MRTTLSRRTWMSSATAVVGTAALAVEESVTNHWRPNYILSSALYGPATLPEILPEVAKTGATSIDLWPKPHGTQREEIESRGVEQVQQLLEKHDVRLGGIACYRPGAFKLDSELAVVRQLGDAETVLVTMAPGDCTLCGKPLDAAIQAFLSKLSPAIKQAESGAGIIAIENHSNSLLNSPESIRRFTTLVESDHIGIALAPHHLPQDGNLLADLAGDAGSSSQVRLCPAIWQWVFRAASQEGGIASDARPWQPRLQTSDAATVVATVQWSGRDLHAPRATRCADSELDR